VVPVLTTGMMIDDALEDHSHMSGPPNEDSFPLADALVSAYFGVVEAFLVLSRKVRECLLLC